MALFGAKQTSAKKTPVAKAKTEKVAPKAEGELNMQELYAAENTEKKSVRTKKGVTASRFDGSFRVLVKPLITEKATELGTQNKYAFVVTGAANKIEVAKAIHAVYGVKALNVNIICMKGKVVTRGRIKGQRKDWKKAIVTLKKGDSIKIYEGV